MNRLLGPSIATSAYTFLLIVMMIKGKVMMKEVMRMKKVLEEYRIKEWNRERLEREREIEEIRRRELDGFVLNSEEEELVARIDGEVARVAD